MSDLVELHGHPTLSSPVMILALEGWIDAGMAAAGAMTAILDGIDTEPLATFDTDVLLDHRARRPMMSLVEGHVEELTWPSIEVRGGMDDVGNHVVLVVGAEPDHGWRRFIGSRRSCTRFSQMPGWARAGNSKNGSSPDA